MYYKKSIIITIALIIIALSINSQNVKKIEVLNSDILMFDENISKEFRRLIGNVQLKHDEAIMYCDSAHLYTVGNFFNAYGNVHVKQGDSLNLYGDYLKYNGNEKIARIRKNVRLENNDAILTTDSLDYDRNTEIGHYYYNGKIVDNKNILTSIHGYYHSKTKDYYAIDSVRLTNPEYIMYSDSLRYNTKSETSFFYGPTKIVSDSSLIYCENGWYNTKTNISQYQKNAYLEKGHQKLQGDSLYYDRNNKFGKGYNNVTITDTIDNVILKGNYAIYFEESEISLMTDSALFIQISQEQDSMFLHADTLYSYTVKDTANEYKIIKAYHKVKIFKNDLQGMCDSLLYSFKDSTIKMFYDPVLWSDSNQLSAEFIEIFTKNEKIDYLVLDKLAFIVSQEDSIKFNQIKGRKITGYFKDDELYKILVEGNGETLYFPKDDEEVIGINKAECSNILIYVVNNDFDRIIFLTKPDALLTPTDQINYSEIHLKDFKWLEKYRPMKWEDVFITSQK